MIRATSRWLVAAAVALAAGGGAIALRGASAQEGARAAAPAPEEVRDHAADNRGLKPNQVALTAEQEAALEIQVVTATARSGHDHPIPLGGKVSLDLERTARVRPLLNSTIFEVKKHAGDEVKKGDEILVVESTDLGDAINAYLTTLANVEVAASTYRRQALTRVAKAVTENDYQTARNAFQTAVVGAEAAREKLLLLGVRPSEIQRIDTELPLASDLPDGGGPADHADDDLQIAHLIPTDAQRESDARRALREIRGRRLSGALPAEDAGRRRARYTIRAPIDGVLISKDAARGELIDPSQVVATVSDLSDLWINLDVYQRDIPFVRKGARVDVTTPTYPDRTFPGVVTYLSETVDDVTHTLKARVVVGNDERLLKSGMAAKTVVHCIDEKPHMELRPDGIVHEREATYVIVRVGKDAKGRSIYERRRVLLGFEGEDSVHVEDGLAEGDQVVVDGELYIHTEIPLGD